MNIYSSYFTFKLYQKGMDGVRCKRVGDATSFSAKRAWNRVTKDLPTTELTQRHLLSLEFEGDERNI